MRTLQSLTSTGRGSGWFGREYNPTLKSRQLFIVSPTVQPGREGINVFPSFFVRSGPVFGLSYQRVYTGLPPTRLSSRQSQCQSYLDPSIDPFGRIGDAP